MRRAQSEDEASNKKAKVRRDRWKDKTCTAKGQEKAERQVERQDLQPQKCGAETTEQAEGGKDVGETTHQGNAN